VSGWAARRFWKAAEIVRDDAGWSVRLDGKPVWTPAKRPFAVPTEAMAAAAAAEWAAQGDRVDPATMPVTRAVNAAIDKVVPHREEVVAALAAYGETDLLCHRAETPDELTLQQAEAWDPLLDWAAATFGARLVPVAGVMPQRQDPVALARLTVEVERLDAFELTGFHDLVILSGSLVLALAVRSGRLDAATAWDVSRLDEEYQAGLWGRDEEAEAAAANRRSAFLAAERFLLLASGRTPQP
jgi:chaperone required for assembly of F1-ATPase